MPGSNANFPFFDGTGIKTQDLAFARSSTPWATPLVLMLTFIDLDFCGISFFLYL
jgi:hypothetical protein